MHAPSYRHTAERVVGPREPQFHTRSPTPQPPAWPVEPGAMLLAAVHDGTRCCADQAPTPGRAGGLQPGGAPPTAQPPAPDGLAAAHAPSRAAPSDGPLATDALTWLACASANGLYGDASPHAPHEPARRVGRKPKSISFEAVVTTFDLPIEHAARVLGVCTTVVKKLCRANGVLRWPYRKLSSRAGAAATRADGAARCSLAAGGRNVSICLGSGEVVRNEDVLVRWERAGAAMPADGQRHDARAASVQRHDDALLLANAAAASCASARPCAPASAEQLGAYNSSCTAECAVMRTGPQPAVGSADGRPRSPVEGALASGAPLAAGAAVADAWPPPRHVTAATPHATGAALVSSAGARAVAHTPELCAAEAAAPARLQLRLSPCVSPTLRACHDGWSTPYQHGGRPLNPSPRALEHAPQLLAMLSGL
ncbi:hypothetical protein KFE25_010982 [Diacronema lutheri]|uniref:RWP-RK domain-containing protein n=1 Tax=Diacronema lutheri TaxID=2081491 RepID=A0A8J5X5L0_DIALT|nr:hypothetical protein KFE25_010982 [Diacronema lutheri]